MTTKDEALKLALEALDVLLTEPIAHKAADRAEYLLLQAAPAMREALAEHCVCGEPNTPGTHRTDGPCLANQPAQQQEPVAEVVEDEFSRQVVGIGRWHRLPNGTKLYTSPPASKPWVGLTDEEVNACDPQEECWNLLEVSRAIEAKLKDKNGY